MCVCVCACECVCVCVIPDMTPERKTDPPFSPSIGRNSTSELVMK